jgi:hypothetical protein
LSPFFSVLQRHVLVHGGTIRTTIRGPFNISTSAGTGETTHGHEQQTK